MNWRKNRKSAKYISRAFLYYGLDIWDEENLESFPWGYDDEVQWIDHDGEAEEFLMKMIYDRIEAPHHPGIRVECRGDIHGRVWFASIDNTYQETEVGSSKEMKLKTELLRLEDEHFMVHEWNERLEKFCKAIEVPFHEPSWVLGGCVGSF